ncbi:MAG: hypothetical protein AAF639_39785 [Chloroflexota bacterium]
MAWAIWFIFAPISTYDTGQIVYTTGKGEVFTRFPIESLDYLQVGQSAIIRPNLTHEIPVASGGGYGKQPPNRIPAVVVSMDPEPESNLLNVTVYTNDADESTLFALNRGLSGHVDIEIAHTTPARLVLQASGGQFVEPSFASRNPR